MPKAKRKAPTFADVRTQGERVVARLRRDAQALITRSRTEVRKEVRDLERRMLKGIHAATEDQVARLERRIVKLEATVAELRKSATDQAA